MVWSTSYARLRMAGVASAFAVDAVSRNPTLSIGSNVQIENGSQLGGGDITLSDQTSVGVDCTLRGDVTIGRGTKLVAENRVVGDVTVGDFCAFAARSSIQQRDHGVNQPSLQGQFYSLQDFPALEGADNEPVDIGSDVWLGLDATVLSGVSIGHGAVVGASSLVTDDVQPFEIVGGNPADHIGWRFPAQIRDLLLDIAWWDWSTKKIQQNEAFFTTDLTTKTPEEIRALID
ncbi:CatB-related O-acetyltransferase [Halomicrococcus gelatinilyticus]|uniref:CatB-related O-acetyltransferase n=1 Tax=Halomicrococcus gelatinilyticus TaxID=1702103 RepID=UPI002E146D27